MGITIRFGGITFNAFISIYLFLASANTPSFATLTVLSNMHGEISILKLRTIYLNLLKDLRHLLIVCVRKSYPDKC